MNGARILGAEDLHARADTAVEIPTAAAGMAGQAGDPDPHSDEVGDVAAHGHPTCLRSSRGRGPCGPTLLDHSVDRAAVTPLNDQAVLIAGPGELQRVDLPDGVGRWRIRPFPDAAGPAADATSVDQRLDHPHADNLRVHAGSGGIVVSQPGDVARIDPVTGVRLWQRQLDLPVARTPPRTWLIEGHVLVVDGTGTLTSLDGDSGKPRWSVDGVSTEVAATSNGLLLTRNGDLGLWHPDSPEPVWSRAGTSLAAFRLPSGATADAPVRLLATRELLDVTDGRTVPIPQGGPSTVRMLGDLTLVLRWPTSASLLELTAIDPDGEVAWQREDLPVACCLAESVFDGGDHLAVGSSTGTSSVLDLADGTTRHRLERPDATLVGISGDRVLWRDDTGIVGTDLATGREAFRAAGTIIGFDPLLISGPTGLVHVTHGGLAPLQPGRQPVARARYR